MLDANKYIDRLRIIVKENESVEEPNFSWFNRVKDLIRDYDRDFDKAMEEMEICGHALNNTEKEEEEGVRRGRETAEYIKKLTDKKDV